MTPHTRTFRLLPETNYLGWAPYLWLLYFPSLFIGPVIGHASAARWVVTIAAGVVFLVLYFRGYWAHGRERLLIIAAIAFLGFGLVPSNTGATVFVTYAAAFAGSMRPRRRAVQVLALIGAGILVSAALRTAPWFVWGFELVLAGTIGTANVHFERVRLINLELRHAREEVEQLARVAERERIARDLHDVLGHTLTLITLKAALAARLVERDPARAVVEIGDVERVAREALHEVRAALVGQREVGLARELVNAREMLGAAGVAVEYAASPMSFSPSEEAALALAMREAVTNIVRHAHATTCRITLHSDGASRVLSIEDDGRGKRGGDGSGLAGMRERVDTLGGRLVVDAGMLSGTRVLIALTGATL